jgi:hypothetical protein
VKKVITLMMVARLASLTKLLLLDLSVPIVAWTALQENMNLLVYALLAMVPPTPLPPAKPPAPPAQVDYGPTLTILAASLTPHVRPALAKLPLVVLVKFVLSASTMVPRTTHSASSARQESSIPTLAALQSLTVKPAQSVAIVLSTPPSVSALLALLGSTTQTLAPLSNPTVSTAARENT